MFRACTELLVHPSKWFCKKGLVCLAEFQFLNASSYVSTKIFAGCRTKWDIQCLTCFYTYPMVSSVNIWYYLPSNISHHLKTERYVIPTYALLWLIILFFRSCKYKRPYSSLSIVYYGFKDYLYHFTEWKYKVRECLFHRVNFFYN